MNTKEANKLFEDILNTIHFSLEYKEELSGYLMYDEELGDYRGYDDGLCVACDAVDIVEELDTFICDSFIDDMTDELESYGIMKKEDIPQTIGDIVTIVQEWKDKPETTTEGKFYKNHAEEIAMMDLIANHIDKVDLSFSYIEDKTKKSCIERD